MQLQTVVVTELDYFPLWEPGVTLLKNWEVGNYMIYWVIQTDNIQA